MLVYLTLAVFAFSIAFSAGTLLLCNRLRKKYDTDFLPSLQYFEIFAIAFGFYGLWGQVILRVFIEPYAGNVLADKVIGFFTLIGLPFLVATWYMLVRMIRDMAGLKTGYQLLTLFVAVNFVILAGFGYYMHQVKGVEADWILRYYFIGFSLLYTSIALSAFFLKGRKKGVKPVDKRMIATLLIASLSIQCVLLFFSTRNDFVGLAFIFCFFFSTLWIPFYLEYKADLALFAENKDEDGSFHDFCKHYEISPRESEVIKEICQGLPNKEIAARLFISLQTVKDHTHRIYLKTGVRNRTELARMVKEKTGA